MEPLTNTHSGALLLMTFLPTVAALLLTFAPAQLARMIALIGTIATMLVSLPFCGGIFDTPSAWTAAVNIPWICSINIDLLMGMDGLSGVLAWLTNLLMILAVLGSWTAIEKRQKEFYFFLLLLQTGILGTFLALDLILFYIFWELM